MLRKAGLLGLAAATLGLGACVVRPARVSYEYSGGTSAGSNTEVYVRTAPPPPMADYRTIEPGPGYVWVDGYWDWTGYDWSWVAGYWVPGRQGYGFVRPNYVVVSGRWVYQPGYWQNSGGERDYHYGQPSRSNGGWRAAPSNNGNPNAGNGGWRAAPSSSGNPNAGNGGWRAAPSSGGNPNADSNGGWRAAPTGAGNPNAGNSGNGGWRAAPSSGEAPAAAAGGGWRAAPQATPEAQGTPMRAAPSGGWSASPSSTTGSPNGTTARANGLGGSTGARSGSCYGTSKVSSGA